MTVKDIISILQQCPGDLPANIHIQYTNGAILRSPGIKICYVDSDGLINDSPVPDTKEISFFVQEALYQLKKNFKDGKS